MGHLKPDTHKKRTILYACETLFYEQGYHKTTMNNILRAAAIDRQEYDSFFSGKMEPALLIYQSLAKSNARIAALFGNSIDRLTGSCLDLKAFWHLFFADDHIRRFSSELTQQNIWKASDTHPLHEECAVISPVRFSERELSWIKIANIAIAKQLNLDAFALARNSNEVSDFYIRTIFKLFEIDSSITEHFILKSQELFEQCLISNNGFHTTFRMRTNTHTDTQCLESR